MSPSRGAPPAVRIGNLVFSSGIRGADSATGRLGEDSTRQAELAFENIQRVVELAGGTMDSIGHVMLWTRGPQLSRRCERHVVGGRSRTITTARAGMRFRSTLIRVSTSSRR